MNKNIFLALALLTAAGSVHADNSWMSTASGRVYETPKRGGVRKAKKVPPCTFKDSQTPRTNATNALDPKAYSDAKDLSTAKRRRTSKAVKPYIALTHQTRKGVKKINQPHGRKFESIRDLSKRNNKRLGKS